MKKIKKFDWLMKYIIKKLKRLKQSVFMIDKNNFQACNSKTYLECRRLCRNSRQNVNSI